MPDGSDAGTNGNESSKGRTDAVVAIRKQLGLAMVDATGWAEQHRRQLAVCSLLGVACGAALLVRMHGLPGITRITSSAQLAASLTL
ncbi:hypothetical protein OEZ86_001086 [Tetradesmus obliquus]|nr:hypothetical protein OEZ86_001086 [Tetradesmus obliquus]